MGGTRPEKWTEAVSLQVYTYSCLPWGRKGTQSRQCFGVSPGFLNSRPHCSPTGLSARGDTGSSLLSGLKNSNPKLIKALSTSHGPFWSQSGCSSTHDSVSPSMLQVQHPNLSRSQRSSQLQHSAALNPNMLSKCLEREQPGGQCTRG